MPQTPDYPVRVVFRAVDVVTGPLRRISAAVRSRLRSISDRTGLTRLTRDFGRVLGSVGRVGREVGRIARRFGVLAAAGVAAGAALVHTYGDAGDRIAKTAATIGITAETFQELRFAADRSGVSTERLDRGLQAFAKRLGEARLGSGALASILRKSDEAFLRQLVGIEDTDEALTLFLEYLSDVPDAASRAALSAAAFSRAAGVDLTNIVANGSEGLREMRERARELGLVMSGEATHAAERYIDATTDLRSVLLGVRNTIGAQLLPTVTRLINRLVDLLVRVRPDIDAFADAFAARLPGVLEELRQLFRDLARELEPVVEFGKRLVERFGPARVILATIAALIGGPLVASLVSATAATLAFTAALVTNPIGLFLTLVGLLIVALGVLVYRMREAGIAFVDVWLLIKLQIARAIDFVLAKVRQLTRALPRWLVDLLVRSTPGGAASFIVRTADDNESNPLARGVERQILNRSLQRVLERGSDRREDRARVEVDFRGAPPGTRVTTAEAPDWIDLATSLGVVLP